MEVGNIPEQHAGNGDSRRRSAERDDRDAGLEAANQFFQDENGARDRRVEGGREASASAGSEQHPAVRPAALEHLPKRWAMLAPIWTLGPSRPSASPDPMADTPPTNFTGMTRNGACGSSPFNTASTRGIPLPDA